MLMEIRHLKLVRAIVEEGNISRAIDKLHLTQSALSHQLKEAESLLGTRIFLRQNKKMVLTKAGEKLYEAAKEILGKLQWTENEIRSLVFGETGEIRISTECYSGYHWLPSVLKLFHKVYPNIELTIVTEATHQPLKKLLENRLDIAVVTDQVKDSSISYMELFQDEMVMVVADEHPWAGKKHVVAEDFAGEHLFIHSFPLEAVTIHQMLLGPAKVSPKKITALPLTEASIEMVKAGLGVMSMAKWAFQPYRNAYGVKSVRIGKNGLQRRHFIAFLNNKEYPDYFFRFIDYLQSEMNHRWNIL
jgi:LysR family transcriptional regulator, regulator for metE and metH